MRKKGHYNPFVAKKIKDKKKKFLAEKAFPKKEFNEYWGKHSDEIFRAVYAAERIKKVMEAKRLLYNNIQDSTPDDYTKLFPLARQVNYHAPKGTWLATPL